MARSQSNIEAEILSLREQNRALSVLVEKRDTELGVCRDYFRAVELATDGDVGHVFRLPVFFARARSLFFR